MKDWQKYIYVVTKDNKHSYRIDYNDIDNSFKRNEKVGSNYEFTLTVTYSTQYKDAFNAIQGKCGLWYNGQFYNVQRMEPGIDEHGFVTKKITCTHTIIDCLKNIRIDDPEPTEDNPTITGGNSSGSSNQTNNQPQAGVTVTKTSEKETYSLESCLHKFIDNNDQGVKFEIHGAFPSLSVEQKGSLYDWITQNFKAFGAYWIPDGLKLKVYDLATLTHKTDRVFRYMSNMTGVDLDYNFQDMVNDCWAYGGKMKKDITTVSTTGGGAPSNGVTSAVNGDWSQAAKNAASIMGVSMNDQQLGVLLAQIKLESGGNETIMGGDDGLSDGRATGLLQFKPGTFNYYSRPPYTQIKRGFDQLIAFFNIPNCFSQITGSHGWSPHGAPISKAAIEVKSAATNDGDNSWGWPFPSVGEGSFTAEQKFGSGSGWIRPGLGTDFHDGLDFGSVDHPGSEVHAIHGGTVTVGPAWGSGGINWYVVIQDGTGLNVEYQEAFGAASNIIVRVGQKVKTGDVIGYRTTNHLHVGITRMNIQQAFGHAGKDDGTWLDPLQVIKNGGAPGGSSGSGDTQVTSSTTSEEYYSLVFHYEDQESIKQYGRHRGKPIVEDSIYDMNTLKQYVENTVQHMPATVLTIDGAHMDGIQAGDQIKLIAPELQLNVDVVLMGIEGPDEDLTGESTDGVTLMFNNTGDAMRDVNSAIWKDVSVINNNLNPLNIYGATGQRQENHFDNQSNQKDTSNQDNTKYSQKQIDEIAAVTRGEKARYDG